MKRPGRHVRHVGNAHIPKIINPEVARAKLKFYDLRARKAFETGAYQVVQRNVRGKLRKFAVATTSAGGKAWRILG